MTTSPTARLEAVCDGVFAIAMTLLIIDVKLPPLPEEVGTRDVWRALAHVTPAALAFLLSFAVIWITWVNHHGMMKQVNGTSAPFIFANGFLLLTVVAIPFPTSLLGEFLLTDHLAPAIVLYDAVLALAALGWVFVASAALRGRLMSDDRATVAMRDGRRNGYFAIGLYGLLALLAVQFPVASVVVTSLTWLFWLIRGLGLRHMEDR